MKHGKKKVLVLLGIIAIIATAGIAAFAFQPTAVDGVITVMAPSFIEGNQSTHLAARNELNNLVTQARTLLNTTDRATAANPSSSNTHYALPVNHDTFRAALEDAQGVLARAGMFRTGDEFDVVVRIASNSEGFSGMFLCLEVPDRLEVVGVRPGAAFVDPSFVAHDSYNSATGRYGTPQTGQVVVGWQGKSDGNLAGDGTLLVYTLRVTGTTNNVTTDNLKISFRSALAPYADRPMGMRGPLNDQGVPSNNVPLTMSLQGINMTGTNMGQEIDLGRVRIIP